MKLPSRFKRSQTSSPAKPNNGFGSAEPPRSGFSHQALGLIPLAAVAILIALLIKAFIIQPYVVDGESMYPTLHNGDRLLVDKLPETFAHISHHAYVPARGDIIIFSQNNLPGYIGSRQLVKRVIGLPGDKVVVKNSRVIVYNSTHPAGFDPDTSDNYQIDEPTAPNSTTLVRKDQLFVMGDNRTNSEDSRYFGPINASQVVGKLSFRIYPLGQTRHF